MKICQFPYQQLFVEKVPLPPLFHIAFLTPLHSEQERMETQICQVSPRCFTLLECPLVGLFHGKVIACRAVLSDFSHVWLFVTSGLQPIRLFWSEGFSRQEYWTGLLSPPPGCLPNPGIEPISLGSPALRAGFLPAEPSGKPKVTSSLWWFIVSLICGQGAESSEKSNGNGCWLWVYFTPEYIFHWMCDAGHDIFYNTYKRINGFQGLFVEINALWDIQVMGGTQQIWLNNSFTMNVGWWYPCVLWLITALEWKLDSLEKTGEEQTYILDHTQHKVTPFTEQFRFTVLLKWNTQKTKESCFLVKGNIPFIWSNGNLFVFCIVHWFTRKSSNWWFAPIYRTFSDQCLLESTEPADYRKVNIHS